MNRRFNALKVGILGGGQLGRMLLQKAADFSLHVKVLDPDPAAPCRYLAEEFVNGSFRDFDTVYTFGRSCDLVTIEIEHVNVEALTKLEQEGIMVYPQPHVIRIVQDKGLQKMFFREHGIPTAGFELAEDRNGLDKLNMQLPVMQKLRKGGYDGKGVFRIVSKEDYSSAFDEPSVVEELVPFKKEIAVIVARNANGETECFPAVDMEFNSEANLVEFLFSPADLSESIEKKASAIATKVANELKIVGVLAVEMFLTENGDILVNEIAPRPHNSGHHTIEANVVSQYEQHLRAILGLPLGNTTTLKHAVMVNLLGEKGYEGLASYESISETLSIPGVYVHLYGKKFTKPFRKMGHVTVTANSRELAIANALKVKKILRVISE